MSAQGGVIAYAENDRVPMINPGSRVWVRKGEYILHIPLWLEHLRQRRSAMRTDYRAKTRRRNRRRK